MGCRCCRMIKSYIYDPSVAGDGRKSDSGSSLYQPHHLSGDPLHGGPDGPGGGGHSNKQQQKQGFHNLAYSKSSSDGTLKLEADNNHFNRLHGAAAERELAMRQTTSPDGRLYIIQPPDGPTPVGGPRWPPTTPQDNRGPMSQVPVYPSMLQDYSTPAYGGHKNHYGGGGDRGGGGGHHNDAWDSSSPVVGDYRHSGTRSGSLSADEGVGGTPDPCDTGDEASVRSVDIHTATTASTASMSSNDERGTAKTPDGTLESGICDVMTKGEEDEEEKEQNVDAQSVTDSMVAEALAALEAATAGEDSD